MAFLMQLPGGFPKITILFLQDLATSVSQEIVQISVVCRDTVKNFRDQCQVLVVLGYWFHV
jgi:hypothetical protein